MNVYVGKEEEGENVSCYKVCGGFREMAGEINQVYSFD
jgi:hypothetical protein